MFAGRLGFSFLRRFWFVLLLGWYGLARALGLVGWGLVVRWLHWLLAQLMCVEFNLGLCEACGLWYWAGWIGWVSCVCSVIFSS